MKIRLLKVVKLYKRLYGEGQVYTSFPPPTIQTSDLGNHTCTSKQNCFLTLSHKTNGSNGDLVVYTGIHLQVSRSLRILLFADCSLYTKHFCRI